MKKITLTITLAMAVIFSAFLPWQASAQAPEAFKYQAVVRDNAGEILSNQYALFKITIWDLPEIGTILYQESFSETTNDYGLVVLEIGTGAIWSGNFSAIDWGNGNKYMEIELDLTGTGINYLSLGVSQLLSVPFALYAESATVHEISDADGDTRITAEENPDEDTLRFYVAGNESMRFDGQTLEMINSKENVFIGEGIKNFGNLGESTLIGFQCGYWAGGSNETYVGYQSGFNLEDGEYNSFFGYKSGYNNSGYYDVTFENTSIGAFSGYNLQEASENVFVGAYSGYNNTIGYDNTFLGHRAGYNIIDGEKNTYIGKESGRANQTGSYNVCLGYRSGSNSSGGDGNVFLGKLSGSNAVGSNKLFIENSDADKYNALIYGEFDNDLLAFNASVGIGTTSPDAKLEVNGGVKIGANGTVFLEIIEITGTTDAGGNSTSVAYPDGYNMIYTRVISLEIFTTSGWSGLGMLYPGEESGVTYSLDSGSITIIYPEVGIYQNSAYRMILMKL